MTDARRRLAIIGMGKMGRVVADLAPERGWDVVARIGDPARGGTGISKQALAGAQVAIEFTAPRAAPENVRAAVEAGCPIVVGTTGWYDELPELEHWVHARNGALLTAPNFSLGINAFERVASLTARLLRGAGSFDVHLVETHHAAKKDAPSGTALNLAKRAAAEWGRDIPITSVRTGAVPGTHEFIFDAPFETVQLTHVARDRRVFAEGALAAAAWLIGRRGVFTMRDVVGVGADSGGL